MDFSRLPIHFILGWPLTILSAIGLLALCGGAMWLLTAMIGHLHWV